MYCVQTLMLSATATQAHIYLILYLPFCLPGTPKTWLSPLLLRCVYLYICIMLTSLSLSAVLLKKVEYQNSKLIHPFQFCSFPPLLSFLLSLLRCPSIPQVLASLRTVRSNFTILANVTTPTNKSVSCRRIPLPHTCSRHDCLPIV